MGELGLTLRFHPSPHPPVQYTLHLAADSPDVNLQVPWGHDTWESSPLLEGPAIHVYDLGVAANWSIFACITKLYLPFLWMWFIKVNFPCQDYAFKYVIPFRRHSQWPPSAHRSPTSLARFTEPFTIWLETTVELVLLSSPHPINRPITQSNVSGETWGFISTPCQPHQLYRIGKQTSI